MDTSRFKRREIQTRRQTVKRLYGVSEVVPRADSSRPQNAPHVNESQIAQNLSLEPGNSVSDEHIQLQHPQTTVPEQFEPKLDPIPAQALNDSQAATNTAPDIYQQQLPISMELPGECSPIRSSGIKVLKKRISNTRRFILRTVAIVLVLIIGIGGVLFSQGYMKLHKTFKGGATTAAALTVNVNPALLKGEGDGRVNVLLLGRGGGNHDGPDLTDTMMLASIDPVNHTATLLSIPRDLWIDMPNHGAMKINAAWETGEFGYLGSEQSGSTNQNAIQAGFDQVDQTVESVLGVPIDYNVMLDFQAFQQAVDTVNGVTVTVPSDLVDPTMAWENGNNPILAKAGVQTFTGAQALNYVRSRETTSDFARAMRQRDVLIAIGNKIETLGTISNPVKLTDLLNELGNDVDTDLSIPDATRMYGIVKAIATNNITSIGMADPPNNYITTGQLDGQAIDLPAAGLFDYDAIQSFVRSQLKDPYIVKENAKILVLNGTTIPGLATAMASNLQSYGYNVVGASEASTANWSRTTLIDLSKGKDKYTNHYLEQRLNLTSINSLPNNSIQTNGADFVIIIGSDETTAPKN